MVAWLGSASAQREEQLILLRFQPGLTGGLIAAAKKFANTQAQLRECNVIRFLNVFHHKE